MPRVNRRVSICTLIEPMPAEPIYQPVLEPVVYVPSDDVEDIDDAEDE